MKDKAGLKLGGFMYLEDNSTCIKITNGRELEVCGIPWTQLLVPRPFSIQRERPCGLALILWIQDFLVIHTLSWFHLSIAGFGQENLLQEM